MAFEKVRKKTKSASKLEVGESIIGYAVRTVVTMGQFGEQTNLIMQDESGDEFTLYTSGTLKYDIEDATIVKMGLLTKITRMVDEDRKNKKTGKSYTTSVFDVEQDKDYRIAVVSATEISSAPSVAAVTSMEATKNRVNALRANVEGKAK